MIGAEHGIGAFILIAGNLMRSDQLLSGVVVLSILGLTLGSLLLGGGLEVAAVNALIQVGSVVSS